MKMGRPDLIVLRALKDTANTSVRGVFLADSTVWAWYLLTESASNTLSQIV